MIQERNISHVVSIHKDRRGGREKERERDGEGGVGEKKVTEKPCFMYVFVL